MNGKIEREMDYIQAQRMIDAAVTKVRGSEVGAYLTVDHPDADVGFQFVMVGPDGRTNRLLASETHQDRLDAHWGGFVEGYGATVKMDRKLPENLVIVDFLTERKHGTVLSKVTSKAKLDTATGDVFDLEAPGDHRYDSENHVGWRILVDGAVLPVASPEGSSFVVGRTHRAAYCERQSRADTRKLQTPRWSVGEWDHTWSWNEDGRMEVKCRVVVDVANEKLVAAQVWGYESWCDADSDQNDDLAKSLFVENKVSVDPRVFDLFEIDRLPTWAARAAGDQQLPPYQNHEVIGLDKDGCVVQWNCDNGIPINSGESVEEFGLHNLCEHELARVGVAREAWEAAVAEQAGKLPEIEVSNDASKLATEPVIRKLFNVTLDWEPGDDEQGDYATSVWARDEDDAIRLVAEEMADSGEVKHDSDDDRAAYIERVVDGAGQFAVEVVENVVDRDLANLLRDRPDALRAIRTILHGEPAVPMTLQQEARRIPKANEVKDRASDAALADLAAGLKMRFADGSVQDAFVVWEGGDDVATSKELDSATRVAKALRVTGSVENIWVTKGSEFETVYDDPRPRVESPSPSM